MPIFFRAPASTATRFPGPSRLLVALTMAGGLSWPATGATQARCTDLDETAGVAQVAPGTARVHFVNNALDARTRACPGSGPACQARAFLVPGNVVLTGAVSGAYTCAGFLDPGGRHLTVDWLPTAVLTPVPPVPSAAVDWVGHWTAPEQDLTIKAAPGGALAVNGSATWGAGDPWKVKNGAVHTGDLDGVARPVAGVLAFTVGDAATLPFAQGGADDCRIRMVRRGPYLVAKDDAMCGGLNVSFTGFYVRLAR